MVCIDLVQCSLINPCRILAKIRQNYMKKAPHALTSGPSPSLVGLSTVNTL